MKKRYDLEVDEHSEPNAKPRKYSGESGFNGALTFVFLLLILFGCGIVAEYYFGVPILDTINEFFDDTFAPKD